MGATRAGCCSQETSNPTPLPPDLAKPRPQLSRHRTEPLKAWGEEAGSTRVRVWQTCLGQGACARTSSYPAVRGVYQTSSLQVRQGR